MRNDFDTLIREARNASDSRALIADAWIYATAENDEILDSVRNYLIDRSDIEFEFATLNLWKPEPEGDHCKECGSTEAGSCFYCKMD